MSNDLPDENSKEYKSIMFRRLAVSYFISLVNYKDVPHVEFVIFRHSGEPSHKISFTMDEWHNIVAFLKEQEET